MSGASLQACGLSRRFGGLQAVVDVSIELHQGEIHAVIGPNGAGKSTLVNLLSGELRADSGTVHLAGRDIGALLQPGRARAGIGRSYQRSTLFPAFSVLENCRLCAQACDQRPWALWETAARCDKSVARANEVLRTVGLEGHAQAIAATLSHGHKRLLEIAMSLAASPRVLLLDEPLAGMGAEETDRVLELLQSLKAGHAILLVEHDMDAVFRVADRITVMVDGRAIASGTPQAIRSDTLVRGAYLGEPAS